jgi:hypothetical protein
VPAPPITLTCDCKTRIQVAYGERWTCPTCGKSYDTSKIPAEEYGVLLAGVRRYKWLTIGPPLLLAAILVPAAVLGDVRYAFLLFVAVMAYGLLVLPKIRERASRRVTEISARWKLEAE